MVYLRNSNTTGFADLSFVLGNAAIGMARLENRQSVFLAKREGVQVDEKLAGKAQPSSEYRGSPGL